MATFGNNIQFTGPCVNSKLLGKLIDTQLCQSMIMIHLFIQRQTLTEAAFNHCSKLQPARILPAGKFVSIHFMICHCMDHFNWYLSCLRMIY